VEAQPAISTSFVKNLLNSISWSNFGYKLGGWKGIWTKYRRISVGRTWQQSDQRIRGQRWLCANFSFETVCGSGFMRRIFPENQILFFHRGSSLFLFTDVFGTDAKNALMEKER
jgi:hypothetical protein